MAQTKTRAPFAKNGLSQPHDSRQKTASVREEAPIERPTERPSARPIQKILLLLGGVLVLGIGSVWGARAWQFGATHVATDDAYLTSDTVPITPQVAGNVAQVLVRD